MSHTIKAAYKRHAKALGEPVGLKAFARDRAKDRTRLEHGDAVTVQGDKSAKTWLAAKAAHRPAKLHREAVKKAKAEGRRAFNKKPSSARRASKGKVAK